MSVSDRQIDSVLEELVPVAQVAEEVKCDRSYLSRLLNRGKLDGRIVNGRWFVRRSAIAPLKESLSTRSAGKRHLAARPSSDR
jgi:hypothetical protein